jgi:hypothetical protein
MKSIPEVVNSFKSEDIQKSAFRVLLGEAGIKQDFIELTGHPLASVSQLTKKRWQPKSQKDTGPMQANQISSSSMTLISTLAINCPLLILQNRRNLRTCKKELL